MALAAGGCGGTSAPTASAPGSTGTLGPTDPTRWVERRVDVNGTSISVSCKGAGAKTVALVSGLAETGAATWGASAVPDLVARETRVCTYDRPGLGASGPASKPRTVANQVADLAGLVEAGAIPAPVVVVGAGYGTFIVRTFAKEHVRQVAGVVLIDPPVALVPDTVPPDLAPGQQAEYESLAAINANFGDFGSGKLPPPPLPSVVVIHTDLPPLPPDPPPGAPRFPTGTAPTGTASTGTASTGTASTGTASTGTAPTGPGPGGTTVSAAGATGSGPVGSAPPGSGVPGSSVPDPAGLVPTSSETPEQRRLAQQQLARKSPYGSFVVVEGSGAYVQYWKPDAVADAIRRVLTDDRGAIR